MKKVMVFGSFDILHPGHLHVFKSALEYGNYLVVVVARNKNIVENKKKEPFHNEEERFGMLSSISLVNKVLLGDLYDPYKVVKLESPDIIALGFDQQIFVDMLDDKIIEFGLETKIVRLPAYKPEKYASRLIKINLHKYI